MLSFALALALLAASPASLSAAPPQAEGWIDDLAAARARAEQEGKPMLVDLWADWCTWCKRLERDVFSTPAFHRYAEGFVLLRVDTEDGGEGTRLKQDFEIESLPTTLLLSHDLIKIGELQGYAPVDPFIQSLELETAIWASLVRAYDDHERATGATSPAAGAATGSGAAATATSPAAAGPGDAGTAEGKIQTLADELHARHDGARAAALYRELIAKGAESAEEEAWNRYYYADALRLSHSFAEAREATRAARAAAASVDNDELAERIDLLPYYLARDTAACDDARRVIDRFVTDHPDGVLLGLAQELQKRMKDAGGCA